MGATQSKLNITHALVKSKNQYFYIEDWKQELKKSKKEQNELKELFVCDVCDENLIPKCGEIKRWHFAHSKSKINCPLKKINQHGKYVYVRNNFMKALIEYDLEQRNFNLPSLLKDYVFNFYKKNDTKDQSIKSVTRRMTDIMNTKTQQCFNFLFKSKVPVEECLLKEKIFGQQKTSWIMSSFDYLSKNNQSFTPLYFMKDSEHPVLSVPLDYSKLESSKYLMIFTKFNIMFLKWEKIIGKDFIENNKSNLVNLKIIVQFKLDNTLGGLLDEKIKINEEMEIKIDEDISKIDTLEWVKKIRLMGKCSKYVENMTMSVLKKMDIVCNSSHYENMKSIDLIIYSTVHQEKLKLLHFNEFLLIFILNNSVFEYYRDFTEDELIILISFDADVYEKIENPSKHLTLYHRLKKQHWRFHISKMMISKNKY